MATQNKYAAPMSKKTDAELIRVLTTDKDSYHPDALQAAEVEMNSRNLTDEQSATAQETHSAAVADEIAKAAEPLGLIDKVLTFILPFRAFIVSMTYRADGYDNKAEEIRKWGLYGIVFYIVFIFLGTWAC